MPDDPSQPHPPLTRRNMLRLSAAAVPAAALLTASPAQADAAPARPSTTRDHTMQLTWKGHSCIRIEHDSFVTVIDPGILSAADAKAVIDDAITLFLSGSLDGREERL